MSTITNNFVAKLGIAFVAVAMLMTLSTPARAQTTAELQQMINDLLAQVASLQAQIGGGSSMSAGVCPYTWTRSLTMGSSGADVMKLQQFLNSDADTRVAATGIGSAGQETEYFGALTAAAVSKFQSKYRSDVLSPSGLVNPTGYFGPASMGKANMLCASAMSDTSDSSMSDTSDSSSSATLKGGEANLSNYDARDGDDTSLMEGQNNAPVMDVEFDVKDGDVRVSRVDVAVTPTNTPTEDHPWDAFKTMTLWVGGDKIASMDVSDKSVWEKNTPDTGDYRVRFTGLDWVVREDETALFTVGLSVAGSVKGAGSDADWEIFIPDNGIRVTDGAGIQSYTGNNAAGDITSFDIGTAGGDDELIVKSSSSDPAATTFQLDSSDKSDWTTVFSFDLDTRNSINDIQVDDLITTLALEDSAGNATSSSALISDVRLSVDGDILGNRTITHNNPTGTASTSVTFDDGEFVISAGDRVTVDVQVKFKALGSTYEGSTITGSVDSANMTAEGVDDVVPSGASTGETHSLRTEGAILDVTSTSETYKTNTADDSTDDQGTFVVKFDVTAFETDLYIVKSAASGTAAGTYGAKYLVQDSTGAQVGTPGNGTSTAALSSNAKTSTGGRYFVPQGETKSFTLTVNFDPATTNFYQVQLYSLNWNSSDAAPDTQQKATPPGPFTTDVLSVAN